MISRWSYLCWFVIPFMLTLVTISLLYRPDYLDMTLVTEEIDSISQIFPATALIGHDISEATLIDAQSHISAINLGLSLDSTVVILLGGVGCSNNQVDLLRYWSEQYTLTHIKDHSILAIYVDPVIGIQQGAYESLLLRRASQASFPFLVSRDPDFNPCAIGIQTPQVVFVKSGIIHQVFDPVVPDSV